MPQIMAPLAPGYEPSLAWLVDQAEKHKHVGGERAVTELLATPAGQQWLRTLIDRHQRAAGRDKQSSMGAPAVQAMASEEADPMAPTTASAPIPPAIQRAVDPLGAVYEEQEQTTSEITQLLQRLGLYRPPQQLPVQTPQQQAFGQVQ